MKIALCKSHFAGPISGADETLVAYALGLHQAGYNVQVVLLYRCADDDQYYLRLKQAAVPVSFVVTRSRVFELMRRVRHYLATAFFFISLVPRSSDVLRRIWQAVMEMMTRSYYRTCRDFFRVACPDILHVFTPDSGVYPPHTGRKRLNWEPRNICPRSKLVTARWKRSCRSAPSSGYYRRAWWRGGPRVSLRYARSQSCR